jgi:2-methylisocitrate lyase-like PEP mutase family enzyme
MTDQTTALRALLDAPGLVRAPGAFDGISAHLVRRAGFPALYFTGAGVAASGFGLPDIGLVTATEMRERLAVVVEASGLPVIADADTGYGNPMHVARTVRHFEQAGAAAIQLEDQAFPKRCGHLTDKEVVKAEEFLDSLHAAQDARRSDTVLIARTDARGPEGLDAALERAQRYAAAGADLIFVEAPESTAEVERVAAEIDAPLVFNVVPGGRTPAVDDAELERLGYRLAIYPAATLFPAVAAMAGALEGMGGEEVARPTGPRAVFELVGLGRWTELADRYR